MNDPRHLNCRQWAVDSDNRIVGVHLHIHEMPNSIYQLLHVEFIPPHLAGGRIVATVTVEDEAGRPDMADVTMCWPYGGEGSDWDECDKQHRMTPMDHVLSQGYNEPNPGPYAIFLGDPSAPLSPVVGGLGLPRGEHACFQITYRRGLSSGPTPPAPDGSRRDRLIQLHNQAQSMADELLRLVEEEPL